jgi:hypothetical protein
MRQFNAEGRRKLGDDAPVDFIPWRWKKHIVSKGQVMTTGKAGGHDLGGLFRTPSSSA